MSSSTHLKKDTSVKRQLFLKNFISEKENDGILSNRLVTPMGNRTNQGVCGFFNDSKMASQMKEEQNTQFTETQFINTQAKDLCSDNEIENVLIGSIKPGSLPLCDFECKRAECLERERIITDQQLRLEDQERKMEELQLRLMKKEGKLAMLKMELRFFKKKHQQLEILSDNGNAGAQPKKGKLIRNSSKSKQQQETTACESTKHSMNNGSIEENTMDDGNAQEDDAYEKRDRLSQYKKMTINTQNASQT